MASVLVAAAPEETLKQFGSSKGLDVYGKDVRSMMELLRIDAVRLEDCFWTPRLRTNREVTLLTQYQLFEETGSIDNLRLGQA